MAHGPRPTARTHAHDLRLVHNLVACAPSSSVPAPRRVRQATHKPTRTHSRKRAASQPRASAHAPTAWYTRPSNSHRAGLIVTRREGGKWRWMQRGAPWMQGAWRWPMRSLSAEKRMDARSQCTGWVAAQCTLRGRLGTPRRTSPCTSGRNLPSSCNGSPNIYRSSSSSGSGTADAFCNSSSYCAIAFWSICTSGGLSAGDSTKDKFGSLSRTEAPHRDDARCREDHRRWQSSQWWAREGIERGQDKGREGGVLLCVKGRDVQQLNTVCGHVRRQQRQQLRGEGGCGAGVDADILARPCAGASGRH